MSSKAKGRHTQHRLTADQIDAMTVSEARDHVRSLQSSGVDCPVCSRRVKTSKRWLTSSMVIGLIRLYVVGDCQVGVPRSLADVAAADPLFAKVTRGGDFVKLVHWGFIEEASGKAAAHSAGGKRKRATSGIYKITAKGETFVLAELAVPRHVILESGSAAQLGGDEVMVSDVLRDVCSYEDMMLRHPTGDSEAEKRHFTTELENEALKQELAKKEQEFKTLAYQTDKEREALLAKSKEVAAPLVLHSLPKTLAQVPDRIAKMLSDKIVFTPNAVKSAADASYGDVAKVWEALCELGQTLWPLMFGDKKSAAPVQDFINQSGIELTLRESGTTKSDGRLCKMRKFDFGGRTHDMSPHIKLGRNFRLHFAIDNENQRFVINHMGDHLETAGTRYVS